MRLTVLGGQGAWPTHGHGCSGYLLQASGYSLLVDPGYATLPELTRLVDVHDLDAVVVSHGHPDHCADLNPLLRARALGDEPTDILPVLAPPGALDQVLALDHMRAIDGPYVLDGVEDGDERELGPFRLQFAELPHHVTNLGMRVSTDRAVIAYSGDSGPDHALVELAQDCDALLVEATGLHTVPDEDRGKLCDIRSAVRQGIDANAEEIILTHLWPGTATSHALDVAVHLGHPRVSIAQPHRTWSLPAVGR